MIAPKRTVSRNTIEPVRATTRRTERAYARHSAKLRRAAAPHRARKCTESVSPPSSSPDRPSPKRLPGGRAFDLRRSVLGAIRKLVAHSAAVKQGESAFSRKLREFRSEPIFRLRPHPSRGNARKNAPRRWLPRPASRLTAAEATACRRAIVLGRSVLGAIGTLGPREASVKAPAMRKGALCELFLTACTRLRLPACALQRSDHGFAEPGALSSTFPADLPLPRTASRESFVLLAPRARRSGNLRCRLRARKWIRRRKGRKLRRDGGT